MMNMETRLCPHCHRPTDTDWPLWMPDGTIQDGGCQECWEAECSREWWKAVRALEAVAQGRPAIPGS